MNRLRAIAFWLRSRAARRAVAEARHIRHLLHYQQDLVPGTGRTELRQALEALDDAVARREATPVAAATRELEATAERWLVDTWKHRVRGVFETLVVAFTIILSVRTFFVQSMSIPTGSMQPTLWGITTENLRNEPDSAIPGFWTRLYEAAVCGRVYYHVVAADDGPVTRIERPEPILPFLAAFPSMTRQRFLIGKTWHTIWFPPRELPNPFLLENPTLIFYHAGLFRPGVPPSHEFHRGEDVIKLAVNAGDHVIADRLTYHFRRPRRGEIVVFTTAGIPGVGEQTHYIKRLVGLPGETVSIGDDRHVRIDGRRLDSRTPGFEAVYAFSGPPRDSVYSGHLNDATAHARLRIPRRSLAPRFETERDRQKVEAGHFLVLGDNSVSSLDGRRWGDLPQEHIIGRYWFSHWPFASKRKTAP